MIDYDEIESPVVLGLGDVASRLSDAGFDSALAPAIWRDMRGNTPVDFDETLLRWECDIISTCGCGRKHSRVDWHALDEVGVWDTGAGEVLDLRNCPCGSTISTPIKGGAE